MPVADVARLVAETTEFKANCNLVIIDFLIRWEVGGGGPGAVCGVSGATCQSPAPKFCNLVISRFKGGKGGGEGLGQSVG